MALRKRIASFPARHLSSQRQEGSNDGYVKSDSKRLIASIAEMAGMNAARMKREGRDYVLYLHNAPGEVAYPGCSLFRIIEALETVNGSMLEIQLEKPRSVKERLLSSLGVGSH